jgi:hypothetical protein
MKKLLLTSLAAAALSLASLSASAATVGPTGFTVQVKLTPTCIASASNVTGVLDFGTYTALTGGASLPTPSFAYSLDCTRNLTTTPVLTFDTAGGGVNGVVAGLNYVLATTAAAQTVGVSASASPLTAGTASKYAFTVSGTMAASQAGDQAGQAAGFTYVDSRTLTVTY